MEGWGPPVAPSRPQSGGSDSYRFATSQDKKDDKSSPKKGKATKSRDMDDLKKEVAMVSPTSCLYTLRWLCSSLSAYPHCPPHYHPHPALSCFPFPTCSPHPHLLHPLLTRLLLIPVLRQNTRCLWKRYAGSTTQTVFRCVGLREQVGG